MAQALLWTAVEFQTVEEWETPAPAPSAVPLSVDALFHQTVRQGEAEPALPVLVQIVELVQD